MQTKPVGIMLSSLLLGNPKYQSNPLPLIEAAIRALRLSMKGNIMVEIEPGSK